MTHTVGPAVDLLVWVTVAGFIAIAWCLSGDVADRLVDDYLAFRYRHEGYVAGFTAVFVSEAVVGYLIAALGKGGHYSGPAHAVANIAAVIALFVGLTAVFVAARVVGAALVTAGRRVVRA